MEELLLAYGRLVFAQTRFLARIAVRHQCYLENVGDYATAYEADALAHNEQRTAQARQAVLDFHYNTRIP